MKDVQTSHLIKFRPSKQKLQTKYFYIKDLHSRITSTYFEEKRHPHVGLFFDASRTRKGKQAIQNRLLFMCAISYPWNTEKRLSNDITCIKIKITFFHISKIRLYRNCLMESLVFFSPGGAVGPCVTPTLHLNPGFSHSLCDSIKFTGLVAPRRAANFYLYFPQSFKL